MDILERLKHFEKHQLELDDQYGAEVLHRAIDTLQAANEKCAPCKRDLKAITNDRNFYRGVLRKEQERRKAANERIAELKLEVTKRDAFLFGQKLEDRYDDFLQRYGIPK